MNRKSKNTEIKEIKLSPNESETNPEGIAPLGVGGGVLLSKRLLGMCRWMKSHFHNWIDYNGVTFLVELLEWGGTFSGILG